ncbi:MAG: zinc metallopeptidase [Bacillota bacterium]
MFFFGDSTFILIIPALILAFYAQAKVSSAFNRYSQVRSQRGVTGAEAARGILNEAGLQDVAVERINGRLSDHYDPRRRVLRLSPDVYDRPSLAALGVAAHEAGHAVQHNVGYAPLRLRNSILPVAQIGSQGAFILFLIGLFMNALALMDLGIIFFAAAVVFQIVTLPVEYNASHRAIALLQSGGYITESEVAPTRAVLSAAGLTYLAATLMAVLQLVRLLALRSQRRD